MFTRSDNETVISYLYKTTGIIYWAAKKPTGWVHWAITRLRLNTAYMKDVAIYYYIRVFTTVHSYPLHHETTERMKTLLLITGYTQPVNSKTL